jgi:hypothetical protein
MVAPPFVNLPFLSWLPGRGAAIAATLALVLAILLAPAAATAAPSNDDFANPRLLEGDELETSGLNFGATKEAGEPNHAGDPGGASVWFAWKAPRAERVTIQSCSYDAWEDVVAVYRGTSLEHLEAVGSSSSQPEGSCREVEFLAGSATTYRIAVDGDSDGGATAVEEGEFSLQLWARTLRTPATPPNDAFAAAADIGTREAAVISESTEGASREPGEPGHPFDLEGASVWYRWTAPRDMRAEFFPCRAGFHPVISVFAGATITGTTPVGVPAPPLPSSLPCMLSGLQGTAFDAVAGTTYSISVDGADGSWGRFDIELQPVPVPVADSFPPLTTIRKLRVRRRRVTVRFQSSEAGSTFLCRLDKKPFKPCTSPRTYRHLSLGGHRFLVKAGDAAGNFDSSPALVSFKVRKR